MPLAAGEKEQEKRSRTEVIVMLRQKMAHYAVFPETTLTVDFSACPIPDAIILFSGNLPPPSGCC
ncbi:MAG: hypothetical protein ACOYXB_01695 [Bacteroidota bacterium]